MRLLRLFNTGFCLLLLCLTSAAYAQTITENQPLRFGELSLTNNNAARQVILNSSGGYTADSEFIVFNDPQLGNVTASGYLPLITLNIVISDATLTGGSAASFVIKDTFTNPATITTDASGEATFDVGATLESDGSGITHTDDSYDGNYTITITP